MLRWVWGSFIIALLAAFVALAGTPVAVASVAKILFVFLLVLFFLSLDSYLFRRL